MSTRATSKSFQQLFAEARRHPEHYKELAILGFTEELVRVMAQTDVSRSELARRIDSSPAYITKVLRGSANFTLASMTKLAHALNVELKLHLAPRGMLTVWRDAYVSRGWRDQHADFTLVAAGRVARYRPVSGGRVYATHGGAPTLVARVHPVDQSNAERHDAVTTAA